MPNTTWHIYALSDPRNGRVRYVGKSDDPQKRLLNHIHNAVVQRKRNHRANWIRQVVASGGQPVVAILESGTGDWQAVEQRWIAHFKQAGADLVNSTSGGEGMHNLREETRARLAEATRLKWQDPVYRARLIALRTGRKQSAETIAKRVAKNTGKKRTAEQRVGMAAAQQVAVQKGKYYSPEVRARISRSQKLRWANPEEYQKAVKRGKKAWADPAKRAARSASVKAIWAKPEMKAKLIEAWKRRKARKNSIQQETL